MAQRSKWTIVRISEFYLIVVCVIGLLIRLLYFRRWIGTFNRWAMPKTHHALIACEGYASRTVSRRT